MRPVRARLLAGLVWSATAAVALQAVLAGQFISGLNDLRFLHLIVGSALELVALIVIVVAVADGWTRRHHRGVWLSTLLFGLALLVQAALGHAPGAAPTAVHVPLGAGLLAWSLLLSLAFARLPRRRGPDREAATAAVSRQAATG